MIEKAQLRQKYSQKRQNMAQAEVANLSKLIQENLLMLPRIITSDTIFTYLSVGKEPGTWSLIINLWNQKKTVAIPKILGDVIMPIKIDAWEELDTNRGILEPKSAKEFKETLDVTIVPGLAFTVHGHRLGRGAGHYDRFLAAHPNTVSIALAFEWQVVAHLPVEPHDQPVDMIVTDHRVIVCKK